ncbi:DUF1761 domain-containing protein [Cribrihabitans pelagius]|uniref:DUF1761 domain-containing protein n=1 Tax=Cribrihabitans pelagius TaxID=1765746 RepID=UPI003B5C1047
MDFLSVILATIAAFALGAGYYGALAKPWMKAARIPRGPDGRPEGADDKKIYAIAFVLQLFVVGMMRHVFVLSGIETLGAGIVGGAGIGLFFISPWLALNNLYGMRPVKLSLIDGGYATLACAVMGLMLTLF